MAGLIASVCLSLPLTHCPRCPSRFTDPIFGPDGDYPISMQRILRPSRHRKNTAAARGDTTAATNGSSPTTAPLLPEFTPAQKEDLRGSSDFFGLNSYGTGWATDDRSAPGGGGCSCYTNVTETGLPKAESAWLYAAGWGLRKLVNWVSKRYGRGTPIFLTEGGWSLAAKTAADGTRDPQRVMYFANYTSEMSRAISEDKVNVKVRSRAVMFCEDWRRAAKSCVWTANDLHECTTWPLYARRPNMLLLVFE